MLETNKYAKLKQKEKQVIDKQWIEVTIEEMKVVTLHSNLRCDKERDHWISAYFSSGITF